MKTALAIVALSALITGCAVPTRTDIGTPRAAIIERLGPPTATYPLQAGERLQYSTQPSGHEVYNMDLDAQGRLVAVEQSLNPDLFNRIQTGVWTQQDVLRNYGKPALMEKVARFPGDVWTYRFFNEHTPYLLHVQIDPAGVVRMVQRFEENPPPSWQ